MESRPETAAAETAQRIAKSLDDEGTREHRHADLAIVGERPEGGEGRVLITAQAQNEIENSIAPVLVRAHVVRVVQRTKLAA